MDALPHWYLDLKKRLVVTPVMTDSRETGQQGMRWGHPVDWIFNVAIGGGQADFDERIANLAPSDRALLYAFFNQNAHVEELVVAFNKLLGGALEMDGSAVIDVGCGPFTAGLALACVVGATAAFDYYGVDRSLSMCELGGVLAEGVFQANAFHTSTSVRFLRDVKDITSPSLSAKPTLVVLSYLLASTSLNVDEITADIIDACNAVSMGSVNLLYTNSRREGARRNYPTLEKLLLNAGFKLVESGEERLVETSKPRDIHYALFHRSPITRIPEHFFAS